MEFNFSRDSPGYFTSILSIFDIFNAPWAQRPPRARGRGVFVGRGTLINREVLPWLWACRGPAMSSRRLCSGFSRDVSCRFSFFFCPSVGHVCGLGQEIPTVPVVPQLRLEGHQSVPAEPRPEIPAGPTGSRCLPLFFFYFVFPTSLLGRSGTGSHRLSKA